MNLIFESFPGKNNFCAHWIAQIAKIFIEIIAQTWNLNVFRGNIFPVFGFFS